MGHTVGFEIVSDVGITLGNADSTAKNCNLVWFDVGASVGGHVEIMVVTARGVNLL